MEENYYKKVSDAPNKCFGKKQLKKAAEEGIVDLAIVAKNADVPFLLEVLSICEKYNVPYAYVESKEQLGVAVGIDVSCAVVAILQEDVSVLKTRKREKKRS